MHIRKEGDGYLSGTMLVQGAHYILGPFGEAHKMGDARVVSVAKPLFSQRTLRGQSRFHALSEPEYWEFSGIPQNPRSSPNR
jgi:hypothetical protein